MKQLVFAASATALLAGCGSFGGSTAPAPAEPAIAPAPPVEAEVQKSQTELINEWFEVKFDEAVARSPMTQTFLGIKTDYDKWNDPSPENQLEELELYRAAVAEMKETFDFEALDDQAKLSWRLFEYELAEEEAAFPFSDHDYTFNQMFGAQSRIPAFMVNQHRITSKSDAEAYVARLVGVRDYLGGHLANAKRSSEKGIRPPLFVYDYVISDATNVVTGAPFEGGDMSPLLEDFRGKLDALIATDEMSRADASALELQARNALLSSVGPAYRELIAFAEAEKAVATTDDGAWKLPDGEAYYAMRLKQMTTTDMTADEIHDLGLAEVARIHDEMRVIMETVGYEGTLQEFFEFTRTDDQFFKPNTEEGKAEYLTEATAYIDIMREALPSQFSTFPKAEMIVKAVEPFREKSAGKAFYQRPAPDGSRPGIYYANLYDTKAMPIYQMEALAYHEGIPGHHMQLAIMQELEGVPSFRRFGGFTAYTEGWGLYSEYFPKEMGFYEDPYSDFGRLAMELWRAARLVVDTGLHDKKWTREEAIQYLIDNTPNPESDAVKAIERYIVMPGQATAYKIGMNKILELRERARAELGDAFDVRDFHDVVLKDGAVPLAILEENVDAWIAKTKGA
ncbi:MAG: DUF885 domain-containing protein [Pseudomonadota bacterium]